MKRKRFLVFLLAILLAVPVCTHVAEAATVPKGPATVTLAYHEGEDVTVRWSGVKNASFYTV